ncbi:MAG: hypothetical protein AAF708_12835, partial [Deinococcota bacterium]
PILYTGEMTAFTSYKVGFSVMTLWFVLSVAHAQSPGSGSTCTGDAYLYREVFEAGSSIDTDRRPTFNLPADGCLSSPFSLTGQAPGTWLYKGLGYVVLLDEAGNLLAEVTLTTDEDWQTSELIDIRGELEFELPTELVGTQGRLEFIKENLVGEPEYDASISFSIVLAGE